MPPTESGIGVRGADRIAVTCLAKDLGPGVFLDGIIARQEDAALGAQVVADPTGQAPGQPPARTSGVARRRGGSWRDGRGPRHPEYATGCRQSGSPRVRMLAKARTTKRKKVGRVKPPARARRGNGPAGAGPGAGAEACAGRRGLCVFDAGGVCGPGDVCGAVGNGVGRTASGRRGRVATPGSCYTEHRSLLDVDLGSLPSLHQEGSFFARCLKKGRSRTNGTAFLALLAAVCLVQKSCKRGASDDSVSQHRVRISPQLFVSDRDVLAVSPTVSRNLARWTGLDPTSRGGQAG